jgi:catalase
MVSQRPTAALWYRWLKAAAQATRHEDADSSARTIACSIRTNTLPQAGEFVYIKYHFIAKHGQKQLSQPEAIRISGENPDYSKQQLWEAIENGEEIEWTAKVQVMKPEEADPLKLGFDPFDVTKVWPRGAFPMHEIGRLVLNKNPENYHRDVEQAAFSPGSMVPGVEDSPDPLLQHRMWFYRDVSIPTQLPYR